MDVAVMIYNKLPDKKYKCILADPPWSYENKKIPGAHFGNGDYAKGVNEIYNTLTIEDIKSLPIQDISLKDSCLFLWATTPLLPEAFEVMKSWGFKYKTSIYWRKIMSLGLGFWFRGRVEVCLFGVKGKIRAFNCQKQNFIQSKVREHSRKPDELYYIIESLDLNPKIELFSRYERKDWDAFGDEIKQSPKIILQSENIMTI